MPLEPDPPCSGNTRPLSIPKKAGSRATEGGMPLVSLTVELLEDAALHAMIPVSSSPMLSIGIVPFITLCLRGYAIP